MHELYKESEVKASEANKECQEGLQKVGGEMAGVVGEVRGNGTRTGLTERFDGMRNAAQEVIEKTFRGVQECSGVSGCRWEGFDGCGCRSLSRVSVSE